MNQDFSFIMNKNPPPPNINQLQLTTIKSILSEFYKKAQDLTPIPNTDVICNKKVFTGFRCLTCETMDTDGSSNFLFFLILSHFRVM